MNDTLFFRVLSDENKSEVLVQAINEASDGCIFRDTLHIANPSSFSQIPGSTFAYWVSEYIRRIFTRFSQMEGNGCIVKQGLATADDFRFLRLYWEISPEQTILITSAMSSEEILQQTFREKYWVPFAKGGTYSPYYSDLHLLINWKRNAEELRNFKDPQTGKPFAYLRNTDCYFRAGITWPLRTQRGLSTRVYPAGCIFANKGSVIISDIASLPYLLGLTNSRAFQELAALQTSFGSYEVGVIQRTPVPELSEMVKVKLGELALACFAMKRELDRVNETSHVFYLPALVTCPGYTLSIRLRVWQEQVERLGRQIVDYQKIIDDLMFHQYCIERTDLQALEIPLNADNQVIDNKEREEDITEIVINGTNHISSLISYILGCSFGRWDICFATGESPTPELPNPFAPLPACSPSMLTGKDGLPLNETPADYPLPIKWDGILVDDQEHSDDLVRRVREVLTVIWGEQAEATEQEMCEILGIKDLREYFRRPGSGGFWTDHIQRYSKSRRKAPIYWSLRSAKHNYAIWLYYHRLD